MNVNVGRVPSVPSGDKDILESICGIAEISVNGFVSDAPAVNHTGSSAEYDEGIVNGFDCGNAIDSDA